MASANGYHRFGRARCVSAAGESQMYRVLIVDDDHAICELLAIALGRRFEVQTALGSAEAVEKLCAQTFDMVVSDINMPQMSGIELLQMVRSRWPKVITVLMTGYDINTYLRQARELGIANIIAKTAPFNFTEIEAELDGLLTGSIFGLTRYLQPSPTILSTFEVKSSDEARTVRTQVCELFRNALGQVRDLELVVDEIVSNAVWHAPAHADGTPKYESLSSVALEVDEYITVECGHDSEKYGLSVSDGSGRLTKEMVLERIERHATGQGLLDLRGRGIHLTRMLSDRMIINIRRGERTEVILLNYFQPKYRGFKPLYINEV